MIAVIGDIRQLPSNGVAAQLSRKANQTFAGAVEAIWSPSFSCLLAPLGQAWHFGIL